MDFGKLGGLGNLGNFASLGNFANLGNIGGGSKSFLIWILLAVIVFGFGKGRSVIPQSIFPFGKQPEESHHSRKRYKGAPPVTVAPITGFANFGKGGLGSIIGGNGLFIVIVIALLFICKDKTDNENVNNYSESDEVVDE